MKNLFLLLVPFLAIGCGENCIEIGIPACSETVPNEACAAAFQRWFYNDNTNTCELIAYSGCDFYGFETEAECEDCICND